MNMKTGKLWALLLTLALGVSLMAGCGSSKTSDVKESEEKSANEEQQIVGTLEDITMTDVTLRVNDGRVLTFDVNDVEHSFSYGIDKGNWVTVVYEGELKDKDTSSLKVVRIHDEDTDYVKEIKAQTTIKDTEDTVYALEDMQVRDNYMMASNPVGELKARDSVKRTGICNNGWNRIEYQGKEAYAYGSLLTTNKNETGDTGSTKSFSQMVKVKEMKETVYAKTDLTVRQGYSTASKSVGALKAGSSAERTGICDNGWSRIMYNGSPGFVYSNLLSTVSPNSKHLGVQVTTVNETVYAAQDFEIKESWDKGAKVLGSAKKGDSLIRSGIFKNGFSRVAYYGKTGYVKSDLLSKTNPKDVKKVTIYKKSGKAWTATKTNVRKSYSASSKSLGVLKKGSAVTITGVTDNNWSRVKYEGKTGYINNDLLTSSNPVKKDVKRETDKKKDSGKKKDSDKKKIKPDAEPEKEEEAEPEEPEKKEETEPEEEPEKKEEAKPEEEPEKKEEAKPEEGSEKKEAEEVKVPADAKTITGVVKGYDLQSVTIQIDADQVPVSSQTKEADKAADQPQADKGDGTDKYPSKTYSEVKGKEDTFLTFDIRGASQIFKNGISKELKVKIFYTGDIKEMAKVKVYKVTDDLNAK